MLGVFSRGITPIDGKKFGRFFWKVVLDVNDNTAVGLVGVNNPHLSESEAASDEYRVCSEIPGHPLLDRVDDVDSVEEGIVYACIYEDLRHAFEEVPDLDEKPGLLI